MTEIIPKIKEEIITTSNIEEMKDMYLAQRLLRTWKEDFVDEDTGETISIDRNELIFERGTYLSPDKLAEINFLLQSKDIKEVKISNQKRESFLVKGFFSVWLVTIELNSKKKNIYLYANSVESATVIATDFAEQKYSGSFRFKTVKETDFSNLLTNSELTAKEEESEYYKMVVEVYDEEQGDSYTQSFILKATDAEKAKTHIIYFLQESRKERGNDSTFEVTIISAKTISCNDVIDKDFCTEYLEYLDNEIH